MGLFLVEPKRLDANIAKAEARAAKKAEAGKKRKQLSDAAEQPAAKRAAVASHEAPNVPLPVPIPPPPAPLLSDKTTNPGDAPIGTTDPSDVPDVPLDSDDVPDVPLNSGDVPDVPLDSGDVPDIPLNSGNVPDVPLDSGDVPDVPLDSDVLPRPPTISLDEYRADRRAAYDAVVAHEPTWKKQTKKKGADRLEPALDDLINAPTRQPGDPCYREPVMIFFGNDKTGRWYSVLRDLKKLPYLRI
jgi:hypothetical protein